MRPAEIILDHFEAVREALARANGPKGLHPGAPQDRRQGLVGLRRANMGCGEKPHPH